MELSSSYQASNVEIMYRQEEENHTTTQLGYPDSHAKRVNVIFVLNKIHWRNGQIQYGGLFLEMKNLEEIGSKRMRKLLTLWDSLFIERSIKVKNTSDEVPDSSIGRCSNVNRTLEKIRKRYYWDGYFRRWLKDVVVQFSNAEI
ncbi:hypothetical protein HZH68_013964 [Vespula germanica]|uniref:Uncharacterized protein n=1 Tax=Vespula germanica TaxID=30212 RepID=A0A834MVV1_VESGE|nr:hypothetical protein HZH68_013964 [Vespula germanica]